MIRNTIYNWIFDDMLCRRGRGVGVKITMGEGNVSNRVGEGGDVDVRWGVGHTSYL